MIIKDIFMVFNPNKTPVEILKEESFGWACFGNIYSNVTNKLYNASINTSFHYNLTPK